jgi:hypothetical protein
MAFPANKTTGKAVADIKALFFYKFADNGNAEPVISTSLTSDKWFPVITLRGTVNVDQDDVSKEKINIDQSNMPIGITTEPGDFNFEAVLPSLAAADLANWLTPGATKVTFDGKEGYGYDLDGQVIESSVLIQTRTGDTIIFSHCMVSVVFNKEDKVFSLRLTGEVLGHTNDSNNDMYILADPAQA